MRRYVPLVVNEEETDRRHSTFLIRLNVDISLMYFQVDKVVVMSRN